MKNTLSLLVALFLTLPWTSASPLPEVESQKQLNEEVIKFVLKRSNGAMDVRDYESPAKNDAINNDERDWEEGLAQMIGNPETYGRHASQNAFGGAELRGTTSDPRIVKASLTLFEEILKLAESPAEGRGDFETVGFLSFTGTLAKVKHPEVLSKLLEYANSERERGNQFYNHFSYQYIAEGVARHGLPEHLPKAKALLERLNGINSEKVGDLKKARMILGRGIAKIERRADKSGLGATYLDDQHQERNGETTWHQRVRKNWAWLAGIASVLLISIFVMKMKK